MLRVDDTDAMFLAVESGLGLQHVGGVCLLDVTAEGFSRERLDRTLGERIAFVPRFRWRVRETPLGLANPVWVEDDAFDLQRHLKRIGVPRPGGARELGELIGQLHAQPLDRRFPLWEMWFVEGVAGGRLAAYYLKMHHSLMDGKSGLGLGELLFDLEPEPTGPYQPALGTFASEPIGTRQPSDLELVVRALPRIAAMPRRSLGWATGTVGRAITSARLGKAPGLPGLNGPATSLNGAVGTRRQLVMSSIGLADTKLLAKHLDVKVNDVVMAIVAGAARRYLERQGELPEGALAAMMNFSTRRPGDTKHNAVTTARVELPTHLSDPLERVAAVHRATSHAKRTVAAMSAKDIQSIGGIAPPVILNLASRLLVSNTLIGRYPRFAAVIVSNMPGPPVPLYVAGARVMAIYTTSIIMGNVPTNMTCVSYVDRIDFGITVDPDLVRRADELTVDVPAALQELLDAAGLGTAEPIADLFDTGREPLTQTPA